MDQCLVEQRYVRGAQLRTLIYNQVGVLARGLCWGEVTGPPQFGYVHTMPS